MKQGLIHVYTGDGKGKTTAALGLALRASGHGLKTVLVQFLKGQDVGELHALAHLDHIKVLRYSQDFGFYAFADEATKEQMRAQNNANLTEACRLIDQGLCDLLILDEVCAAYQNNAVSRKAVDALLANKPAALELVLTGRNAPPHFIERADYVTELVKHKHPYESGIAAREGIEF